MLYLCTYMAFFIELSNQVSSKNDTIDFQHAILLTHLYLNTTDVPSFYYVYIIILSLNSSTPSKLTSLKLIKCIVH